MPFKKPRHLRRPALKPKPEASEKTARPFSYATFSHGRPRLENLVVAKKPRPEPEHVRNISRISRILSQLDLPLKKGLGQNFLVNQGALEKIAASLGDTENSIVMDIGSGLGNLTELIARRAGSVLAIELDERFRPVHQVELRHFKNIQFLYGDFMELDLKAILPDAEKMDIRVAGNIPYHLTSPILFKLMASSLNFSRICLLMQREVAQRLVAQPGSREYGILAAKISTRYNAELAFIVSPGSFLPPPKIYSALVRFTPRPEGPLVSDSEERQNFFNFIDSAFAQRRKMIGKSIEAGTSGTIHREDVEKALVELGFLATARAEELAVNDLLALFRKLGSPRLPAIRKTYQE
jgi:16S rRNA (adenine1518-N6/adenine1519-N6)-dimethyltransferase